MSSGWFCIVILFADEGIAWNLKVKLVFWGIYWITIVVNCCSFFWMEKNGEWDTWECLKRLSDQWPVSVFGHLEWLAFFAFSVGVASEVTMQFINLKNSWTDRFETGKLMFLKKM